MIHITGTSRLALKYSDEELGELIDNYIVDNNMFTYGQLCSYAVSIADQDDMLLKQPNTTYSQIAMTNEDKRRICKLLWDRIWAKDLLILFNDPNDIYMRNNETYFMSNK